MHTTIVGVRFHPAPAYHAGNHARLAAVENAYDPHRFFDFPQAS